MSHVTSYLRSLVEITESESQRLITYAQREINKEEYKIKVSLRDSENSQDFGKFTRDNTEIEWHYRARKCELLAASLFVQGKQKGSALNPNFLFIEWYDQALHIANWYMPSFKLESFKLGMKPNYVYPTIRSVRRGAYLISFRKCDGIRSNNGIGSNNRFPAVILYDYEANKIEGASYVSGGKITTFWTIYDLASPQDKKILIRDWLPLEEKT